ncbi:MAG: hypothetical protein N5P05_001362 [Chroococcopsis gigantea SAG 12.99]|nr:hypothetical protein [Chroococcopsis gigantea SAG 12.99]
MEARSWSINDILRAQEHLKGSEAQIKHTTQPRLWLEITLMGLIGVVSLQRPRTTQNHLYCPQTPEVKTTLPVVSHQ